jgi:hypothetical protein
MVDETAIQEIILQVLPQPAYVATLQDKTRYKYDILISNKSSSDMTISGLDIEFFNNNGPIDGLNKYYYGVL